MTSLSNLSIKPILVKDSKYVGRVCKLQIDDMQGHYIIAKPLDLTQIRATFRISLNNCIDLQTAEISLYNADPFIVDMVTKGDITQQKIILTVGYRNAQPKVIFSDVGLVAYENKEGTDKILTIHSQVNVIPDIPIVKTFDNNALPRDIMNFLAQKLMAEGVKLSKIVIDKDFKINSSKGLSLQGKIKDCIDNLCSDNTIISSDPKKSIYFSWNIVDNVLYIFNTRSSYVNKTISLSFNTGLLEYPQLIQQSFGIGYQMVANTFLNPEIVPGALAVADASLYNLALVPSMLSPEGQQTQLQDAENDKYVIIKVDHQGDTRGNLWKTTLLGSAFKAGT